MLQSPLRVFINTCWRARGTPSFENYFVIGRSKDGFEINYAPMGDLVRFVSAMDGYFAKNKMMKYAFGYLNPNRMTFLDDPRSDPLEFREILRAAFLNSYADRELGRFLQATVYIGGRSLNFTIASLLTRDLH